IVKDGDQFVRVERHLRHEIAGLDVLRIGNPGSEIAGVSRQGARGDGVPAGDVREIRPELSARERTADGVAETAAPAAKQLFAADTERIAGARRTVVLVIAPPRVFVWRQHLDGERHVGVLRTAKFSALPAVNPGSFRGKL